MWQEEKVQRHNEIEVSPALEKGNWHHDACPVGMGNEMSHGQGVGTGHQGCQRGLVENPMTQQEGTGSNSCRRNGHNYQEEV